MTYDWQQIRKHNQKKDCWIVIDGSVYDVTEWIPNHPGGDVISVLAGEDASAMFYSSHKLDPKKFMQPYLIGQVKDYKPDFAEFVDEFYLELKQRVYGYFSENKIDYRNTKKSRRLLFLSFLLFMILWGAMYLLPPWGILAALPMGLITCSFIGSYGHEHVHNNLYHHIKNRGLLYGILNSLRWGIMIPFMPETFFRYEHIRHHLNLVDPKDDYEVLALGDFVRLSPNMERKWYHSYQHKYAPIVYGFYIFLQNIGGITTDFFKGRELWREPWAISQHILTFAFAFTFHILLPIYLTNIYWVMACAFIYFFTWQSAIYVTAAVPHMTKLDSVQQQADSWPLHVCQRTTNQLCGNAFYDWLTGGFNYQIEHHLLPSIPQEHLPKIQHIVEQTCKDFSYPYYSYKSFRSYYGDHYNYLFDLGTT